MITASPLQERQGTEFEFQTPAMLPTMTGTSSYPRAFFLSQPRTASRMISERDLPSSSAIASSANRSCLSSITAVCSNICRLRRAPRLLLIACSNIFSF